MRPAEDVAREFVARLGVLWRDRIDFADIACLIERERWAGIVAALTPANERSALQQKTMDDAQDVNCKKYSPMDTHMGLSDYCWRCGRSRADHAKGASS